MPKIYPVVLALSLALAAPACAQGIHPLSVAQPEAEDEFLMIVEIPAGRFTKYEIDKASGLMRVDRFLQAPVVYPANYGTLPSTRAGDGDPLDALVITREPIVPGALIQARAIGVLRMTDAGEADDKIIAVPGSGIDAFYSDVRTLSELPAAQVQQIETFFRIYKQLPDGSTPVVLDGFGDVDEARGMIEAARKAYAFP
jgi:inorganic pyrophosphatase